MGPLERTGGRLVSWLAYLRLRARALLWRRRVEWEIEEELRLHVELERQELLRSGLDARTARAEAERRFGDFQRIREECRQLYTLPGSTVQTAGSTTSKGDLDMLLQDLRFALRALRHRPGITAVAVVTLTLGIGANVAIFSVVHAVLWRALPVDHPERIVVAQTHETDTGQTFSSVTYPDYLDFRAQTDVFEEVAILTNRGFDLAGTGEPERVRGLAVSEAYFPILRTMPVLGRALEPGDFAPGAPEAAVLGEGLWRRRFGGDPGVLGRPVRLSGRAYTVVGVVDTTKVLPSFPEVFVPLDFGSSPPDSLMRRDNYFLQAFARLRDGTSLDEARARLAVLSRRIAEEVPEDRANVESVLIGVRERLVRPEMRLALKLLLGAVGLVLAVACFNVANLLLTRALERRREMAVRLALGAGRGRLARQLLVEGLVLAAASCTLGLAVGHLGLRGLLAMVPSGVPLPDDIGLDGPVVAFGLVVSALTALVFGLVPVWQTTRRGLNDFLRVSSTGGGAAVGSRARSGLVVAEVALSLLLLVTAGLLMRSFHRLSGSEPGVELRDRLTLTVRLPGSRYPEKPQVDRFYGELLDRIERLPRVRSAAATSWLPVGGGGVELQRAHLAEGMPEPPAGPEVPAAWNVVTPGYFETSGIRLLAGRDFDRTDRQGSPPVMMVNEAFAEQMFPSESPLGKRVRSWRDEDLLREVIGVVSNVRLDGLADPWQPIVYVPARQTEWPRLQALLVETEGDPMALADAVRAEVWDLDGELPVTDMATLETLAASSLGRERFVAFLLGTFALVALALASVGLYGLVSCSVSQRTREIGVRMALGALGGDILAMVVRQGLRLALLGVGLGLGAAFVAGRAVEALLFQVSASDPSTYVGVALLLAGVALVASLVPALRATRIDPLRVLRYE